MNIQTRLSRLEERAARRETGGHPLHRLMALAVEDPAVGDCMDALASAAQPVIGDEPNELTIDELFDHIYSRISGKEIL